MGNQEDYDAYDEEDIEEDYDAYDAEDIEELTGNQEDYDAYDEEDIEDYRPGGYHAVYPGDTFKHGRYVVRSKLGWGGFSTVWHAWDTFLSRHVALKVMKSEWKYEEEAMAEIDILCETHCHDPDGSRGVVRLYEWFDHHGPNGVHVCIVLELLGDDLFTLLRRFGRPGLPLPAVKEICRHLLAALDYLHRELQIIHGDLKPDNVLLISPVGSPSEEGLAGVDLRCKLADLGTARWVEKAHWEGMQTGPYRCPEVLLGTGYSAAADMWSLACVCFELATGEPLFDPRAREDYDEDEDHLAYIIELLGKMPPKIRDGRNKRQFFDEHGELKHVKELHFCPLDEVLVRLHGFSRRDADDMARFLRPMLNYEPELRPTPRLWLDHPWLDAGPWRLQPSADAREDEDEKEGEPDVEAERLEDTSVDAAGEEDPRINGEDEEEEDDDDDDEFDVQDIKLVLGSLGRRQQGVKDMEEEEAVQKRLQNIAVG